MKQLWTITLLVAISIGTTLQAQNWVRQHPNHSINDLNDICFNDQGKGIAVGEGKALLTTSNGGNTWVEQTFPLTANAFFKVRFAPAPGSQVAYLLENTRIYKSMDAGVTWTQLTLTGGILSSTKGLEVLSENEVFVQGHSNILHSIDGGDSWTAIDKPINVSIKSLQFHSTQIGWIGGTKGEIFKTTDGGANWNVMDTTQFDKPVKLRFFDATVGYAEINKDLVKTSNGGATWTVVAAGAFSTNITDMAIVDASTAYFSMGNRMYYTHDGGSTVPYSQPFRYSNAIKGIYVNPGGQVWSVADYHSIGYSGDAGMHYEEQVPGNKNFLQDISFIDKDHGWATGYDFTILKTDNGGDTWADMSPVPALTSMWIVRGGLAVSVDEFWVCGTNFVSKTTDGGATWNAAGQPISSVNALVATSNAVYSAQSNGRVYKTTNGGSSWTYGDVQAQSTLIDLYFPSDNVGYVGGWNGVFAKTTDAGATWTVLDFPVTDNIGEIYFLDENTGWVALDRFTTSLYHTTDGGQSWSIIGLPNSAYWYEVNFLDTQRGFVAGGSAGAGRVVSTVDGGLTWNSQFDGDLQVRDLAVVPTANEHLLWVCGPGGNIEHTSISQLSAIFENNDAEPLRIFPNPASGTAIIAHADQFSPEAQLVIRDISGRVVASYAGVPNTLGLASIPAGLYLVQIRDGARLYVGKLVVE